MRTRFARLRKLQRGDRTLILWALVEQIEAASRSDRSEAARLALERLDGCVLDCGNNWAVGLGARSKALLAEGEEAEALFQEAIERLGRTRVVIHLGRAYLVYGEWLRRLNRRIDAREQLNKALQILSDVGASAFAARAQAELLATCETVQKRTVDTSTSSPHRRRGRRASPVTATRIRKSPLASSSVRAQLQWHCQGLHSSSG